MKGRISERLERILANPVAREQFKVALLAGVDSKTIIEAEDGKFVIVSLKDLQRAQADPRDDVRL